MAIIYETKEDLERKTLRDQANELHAKSNSETVTALSAIGISLFADNYNLKKAIPSRGLGFFSGLFQVFGLVEAVKSYLSTRDAHKVERELELKGTQVVLHPVEHQVSEAMLGLDNMTTTKNFSHIQPREQITSQNMLEHAEKSDCGYGKSF